MISPRDETKREGRVAWFVSSSADQHVGAPRHACLAGFTYIVRSAVLAFMFPTERKFLKPAGAVEVCLCVCLLNVDVFFITLLAFFCIGLLPSLLIQFTLIWTLISLHLPTPPHPDRHTVAGGHTDTTMHSNLQFTFSIGAEVNIA